MRKRQIAATLPIEAQIEEVEMGIKRKGKMVGKLRMEEERVAEQRRCAEENLMQLKESLVQLNEIKNEMDFDADEMDENKLAGDLMNRLGTTSSGPPSTIGSATSDQIGGQLDYLTKAVDMLMNHMSSMGVPMPPTEQVALAPSMGTPQAAAMRAIGTPTRPVPPGGSAHNRAAAVAPYLTGTPRAARARGTPTNPGAQTLAEESPGIQITGVRFAPAQGSTASAEGIPPAAQAPAATQPPAASQVAPVDTGLATVTETDATPEIG
jgi:hypothetical protein